MNYILLYTILILIVLLFYFIINKVIILFFGWKKKQATSLTYPIIRGFSVLVSVYLARHHFITIIIKQAETLVNNIFKSDIILPTAESSTTTTIEAIVLYIIVGSIVIVYILKSFSKEIRESTNKESDEANRQVIEIKYPDDPPSPSPIFHKRVKHVFELKYERVGLKLSYDKEFRLLYGTYKYGLHQYVKIIYCHETTNPLTITKEKALETHNTILEVIKSHKLSQHSKDVVDLYYILEQGGFKDVDCDMIFKTENGFIEELVDFKRYLNQLIVRFEKQKLSFSSGDKENKKYSLSETFIQPRYTKSEDKKELENLNDYIDTWLNQSNNKHLVILGDYGMGKSSFLKYYSSKLANDILNDKGFIRYPVFISLTNTSPMHGGISKSIGKFISDNIGVSTTLFNELVNRGKIVFILDGFDEMGYIGTHEQRIKHLNAIWQLATKKNKIIISGRPSYFPTTVELNTCLNILDDNSILTPIDNPYFERIELIGFNDDEIYQSISKYNYSEDDCQEYFRFIVNSSSIFDLCKRPSMMHIVREMLPKLFKEHDVEKINSSTLMSQYIDHWIERQLLKNIISPLDDKNKSAFIKIFYADLAADYLVKGVEKQSAEEITDFLSTKIGSLNIENKNDTEGLESELLSGYFIEIEDDSYRFVHKSFREYLASQKIITLLKEKDFKHLLIEKTDWSREIIDFIFDSLIFDSNEDNTEYPLLIDYANISIFRKRLISRSINLYSFCFLPVLKARLKKSYIKSSENIRVVFYLYQIVLIWGIIDFSLARGFISFFYSRNNEWKRTNLSFYIKAFYASYVRGLLNEKQYNSIKQFFEMKHELELEKVKGLNK